MKNAYTTVRSGDVISYKLKSPVDGKDIRLAVLSPDGKLLPLCNPEKGSSVFEVDPFEESLDAEKLKSENRLG
jgi:hypothetical protein